MSLNADELVYHCPIAESADMCSFQGMPEKVSFCNAEIGRGYSGPKSLLQPKS